MNADDTQLIEAVRRGELRAATEFVDRFYESIYGFLRRLAGNEPDAADLTQKTFSQVWLAVPRFAGRSSVSSWLHGIAYHVYQDWLRTNHRLEARSEDWWADCPDPRPQPDALAAQADLAATLFAAVERLEPDARGTVHLHYYQGLTLDETAEALGIAASTVKYRLRHAVQQLQSRVTDPPSRALNPNLVRKP
ncbi:MAG: RNA polymerase sigma factor [Limisphaerales bacterium]